MLGISLPQFLRGEFWVRAVPAPFFVLALGGVNVNDCLISSLSLPVSSEFPLTHLTPLPTSFEVPIPKSWTACSQDTFNFLNSFNGDFPTEIKNKLKSGEGSVLFFFLTLPFTVDWDYWCRQKEDAGGWKNCKMFPSKL